MPNIEPTRRAALAAAALPTLVHVAPGAELATKPLKVGLVGCGGRGRGAVGDALAADANITITALCDIFPDFLEAAHESLAKAYGPRLDVPPQRRFSGFDGYQQLIDSGVDVVLLATPPGFRPQQLQYAVAQGKHVFAEKPLAVDAPGVRSVIASAKLAKEKNLLCASGFCYRYDLAKRATLKRIHDGQIGDVNAIHVTYNTGSLWHRGTKPTWSEMEYQIRNWYYYSWLSGDHIVEQHCHSIDKACWVLDGKYPVAATALGGRQARTDAKYGNIYDHFAVVFEYTDGTKVFSNCRQQDGCANDVSDTVYGTKGTASLMKHSINVGGTKWFYDDDKTGSMYEQEHNEFFASIRAGTPINDMERAAHSTLMAILGRQAAYTGKRLTWKQMLDSNEQLTPAEYSWGPHPVPPVAVPGVTKFA